MNKMSGSILALSQNSWSSAQRRARHEEGVDRAKEQIIGILQKAEPGRPIMAVSAAHNVNSATS